MSPKPSPGQIREINDSIRYAMWSVFKVTGPLPEDRAKLAAEVEALFAGHGFVVVHPEDHPLADQVRMVRDAEVVAGFAGSGMFQIALAGGPKHVVLVGSESYTASNEYLISSVVGHRLDLVLCRPDVVRTAGFDNASYQSDFTYDDRREGVFLRSVLAELSGDGEHPETALGYERT